MNANQIEEMIRNNVEIQNCNRIKEGLPLHSESYREVVEMEIELQKRQLKILKEIN